MAGTVNEAFDTLLTWIKPTEVETSSAASHRQSIEACLKANFGMTSFFRAGSFGHGTSVSGYSDVDYFAVIPSANLKADSSAALRDIREALERRFPNTGAYVNSPAVAIPFGNRLSERHEITPAFVDDTSKAYTVYGIPDRASGWMKSAPLGHNSYTNVENDRLNKKAKQVIRFVKLWNYRLGGGIRSLYIELRVIEYLKNETTVVFPIDVKNAFRHMVNKGLAAMQDPLGLSGWIYPCTDAVKPGALSKLNSAMTRAEKALDANSGNKVADAFAWWSMVFDGYFPSYG